MITHTKTDHRIEYRRGENSCWAHLAGDEFRECQRLSHAGRFQEAINLAYDIAAKPDGVLHGWRFRCVTYSISVHADSFEHMRDLEI